jgi:cytochrome c oxidase assembly protein subunit 15
MSYIMQKKLDKQILIWLIGSMIFIATIVLVGGLTRLTESGLSITKWDLFVGIFPPLSEAKWQIFFSQYQQIPEYKQVNYGMSLAQFKSIFWLEYLHRLIARLFGLFFLLPLIYFTVQVRSRSMLKYWGMFLLIFAQGVVGWFMVKSGLSENTDVSHYRLAFHLGTAFVIFGLIWWQVLQLSNIVKQHSSLKYFSYFITILIFVQIVWGAFVAGLNAGLLYNEFPFMGASIVPMEFAAMQPFWLNFFENHASVQFIHRVLGVLILLAVSIFVALRRERWSILFLIIVVMQVIFGISTLLYQVPIGMASLHQMMALAVFAVSVKINNQIR